MTKLATVCTAIAVVALSSAAAPTATFARGANVAHVQGKVATGDLVTGLNRKVGGGDERLQEATGKALQGSKTVAVVPAAQRVNLSPEQRCLAFQQQVKRCEVAMQGGGEGFISRDCAGILARSVRSPCG